MQHTDLALTTQNRKKPAPAGLVTIAMSQVFTENCCPNGIQAHIQTKLTISLRYVMAIPKTIRTLHTGGS